MQGFSRGNRNVIEILLMYFLALYVRSTARILRICPVGRVVRDCAVCIGALMTLFEFMKNAFDGIVI